MLVCLSCIFAVALNVFENTDDAEFKTLADTYSLNANSFLSWKLDVRMRVGDTEAQKECWRVNSTFQRENANESMLSQEMVHQLRQNLPAGKTFAEEVGRIISEEAARFEERASAPDLVLIYGFERAINGRILRIPVAENNPIITEARAKGLKSLTGGEFTIAQQLEGEDWFGLEPFPFVGKKYPVSWRMDSLKGFYAIPPIFPPDRISTNYGDIFGDFYGTTTGLRRIRLQSESTEAVIFSRRDGENDMLIAKILPARGAFPAWVARWRLLDRTFESLSTEELVNAAETSESFATNETVKRKREAFGVLNTLAVAEDIEEIPDLGWYPSQITYSRVSALFKPGDDPRNTLSIDFGRVSHVVVEMLKVAASEPDALRPIEIPDGTAWLDVDTRESGVKGDPLPDSISELLTDRRTRSRTMFVVANMFAALAVLLWIISRRRKKNNESSSKQGAA